jgi:uncharacterized repeat protein (TIGR03803 family)
VRKISSCLAVTAISCAVAVGQQYKVLYNFGAHTGDGSNPVSNLVFDKAGNLYGTTSSGGTQSGCFGGCGTIFQLSPNSDGTWTESVLYSFCSTRSQSGLCLDGNEPSAGLILDGHGNLYGTTVHGGPAECADAPDCGTVFQLTPPSSRSEAWTESVLYSFCQQYINHQCLDGLYPYSQLVFDRVGNLYGTTSGGGSGRETAGTVFELSKTGSGWAETVLYNFCSVGSGKVCLDGTAPMAGVTLDKSGVLYGTTAGGGDFQSRGTVYKLTPGNNVWTEMVLGTSKRSNALGPLGTVTLDAAGNVYSTFSEGGTDGFGGVFRLGHSYSWMFSFNGTNGWAPTASVVGDAKRHVLYGTTSGGNQQSPGTVFEMMAPTQVTVLHSFCAQTGCTDGSGPYGALVEDESGNLYGTTKYGGANNQGVVFEILSPDGH